MTLDNPTSLLTTNDVGSHLEGHSGLLKTLHTAQRTALIIDAGGFFGGTGYNRLGGGMAERRILADLYDLCLPAGPGFSHYLADPVLREKGVCTNLTRLDNAPIFRPSRKVRVAGIDTLVLGVIGQEEFEALPAAERSRLRWHSPARCILLCAQSFARRPMPTRRSAIVVLSYSGLDADHEIAKLCPQIDVIVSGDHGGHGVGRVNEATIVSAATHGAGYAVIQPAAAAWNATTTAFPAVVAGRPSKLLLPLHTSIDEMNATLAEPLGAVKPQYRFARASAAQLLTHIARNLLRHAEVDQAVLAESCVNVTRFGKMLTRGQLLETVTTDERLVVIELDIAAAVQLPTTLAQDPGRLVVSGQLPERGTVRLATLASVAAQLAGSPIVAEIGPLADWVRTELTTPADPMPADTAASSAATFPGALAGAGPAS